MTLRYKFVSAPNEHHDKNKKQLDRHHMSLVVAKKLAKLVNPEIDHNEEVEEDEDGEEREQGDESNLLDLSNSIDDRIRWFKKHINKLETSPKANKEIVITSDKTWTLFDEYISDDTGKTQYGSTDGSNYINEEYEIVYKGEKLKGTRIRYNGKGREFKVDIHLPYKRASNNILEEIKSLKLKALDELKEYRKQRQLVPFIEKNYAVKNMPIQMKYKVYAGGGFGTNSHCIHMEKGEIMRLQEASKLRRVFEPKIPKTNDNYVGVEIEFISKGDKYKVAQALADQGVQDFVFLQDDGSLRPEKEDFIHAHELCVLAPEKFINGILKAVMIALDKAECKVNHRCGLHVHLDARNRDRTVMFNNLSKAQRILYAMNPASRVDGTRADGKTKDTIYSKRIEATDFNEAMEMTAGGDRYWGINVAAFNKHKTIEIRIHSGSTNFTKISNWVTILMAIVNKTVMEDTESAKPETFCERYELDDTLLQYIKERIAKFKDKNGKHVTVDEVA